MYAIRSYYVNVLNIEGKETGRKVTLPESVFGIERNNFV